MITTKLVRVLVVGVIVAAAGLVALEVHWSMDTKHDARRAAVHAAGVAAQVLGQAHDSLAARHAAEVEASSAHTQLVAFTIETTGTVRVTVNARAKSYLLR